MPRRPREDAPGVFHHVMNRGLARRTMFEYREDTRAFLATLAREVHSGRIRVHAYVLLSTHFHLLVESVEGRLSESLRLIESPYARRFNRTRGRDGSLVRGRFLSRPLHSIADRATVVSYIDRNPVDAGLARHGVFYPHGSAVHYLRRGGPPWLERSWVESVVCTSLRIRDYDPDRYSAVFRRGMGDEQVEWVEARIRAGARGPDPLDDLIRAAPPHVRVWMTETARLADGTKAGIPIVAAGSVCSAVRNAEKRMGPWSLRLCRNVRSGWDLLLVALLRDLAAETFSAIAVRVGVPKATALSIYSNHAVAMTTCEEYATRAASLGHDAIQRCHGNVAALLAAA
jgi:hypothetical protein